MRQRWPALALVLGIVAIAALTGFAMMRYPGVLDDPAAPVYLALLVLGLLAYGAVPSWLRPPGQAYGVGFGLLAGLSWAVEIWAGGPSGLDRGAERLVGGLGTLLAVGLTIAAGVAYGVTRRDRTGALRAGVCAGLASGVVIFAYGLAMTLTNLGTLAARADYQREFAASGVADVSTFLVGDMLAAVIAHLFLNALLGLLGGGIGAAASGARSRNGQAARPRPR